MKSDPDDAYINVRETARLLGVHENTVRNWAATGVLVSARIPGSRYLRFERAAVMRMQGERGSAASAIGPALRTDGPELVTANELNRWADSQDSKGAFPDLMRRLLASTPGITNLEVRAYEGVAGHGWDGRATSTGSYILPPGELRFEFGTNRDSKTKATSDFEHRDEDSSLTFVAATPRNWPGGAEWADERRSEHKFADVKAIDAHVLEQWLIQTPLVHYWISERLGFNPRGARTMERWWADFSSRTHPKLPGDLFVAGRRAQTEALRDSLAGAPDGEITVVQAPWRDEALAFVFASLESDTQILQRTIVVDDSAAWERIIQSVAPLVLVPLFDGATEIDHALERGHHVVVPASQDEIVRHPKLISLPKIGRSAANDALAEVFPALDQRQQVVALARRSMPALVRRFSRDPRFKAPDWVTDGQTTSIVAPLALVGRWSNADGDLAALETLTRHTRDEISRQLQRLSPRQDAPFIRSARSWRLTSPTEAALLLFPMLTPAELDRWASIVPTVLLADDPYEGMDAVARLTASAKGTRPEFSETLAKGVAGGLSLAASVTDEILNGPEIQRVVDRIVHDLLEAAAADPTGRTWRRLSPSLPDLAEASPEIFMRAVELDLDRPEPILRLMFEDVTSDALGPSSSHPSLLWALERLSWSPTYFGQAADLLAKLAMVDPGGKLSNRPIESLLRITYGWIANSGGESNAKIAVVERVLRRDSETGWKLVLGLWPSSHMTAFPPAQPAYRDWAPQSTSVSFADWGEFVHRLSELAIGAAGEDPRRWVEIIPHVDELPSRDREQVLSCLRDVVGKQRWTAESRFEVWDALRTELSHHEEFPDAQWSLSPDQLGTYHELADLLEPQGDPRKFANLFQWRVTIPGVHSDEPEYASQLARLRNEAVASAIAAGRDALTALTREAKLTNELSAILATRDDAPLDTIVSWLSSGDNTLINAALIFMNLQMVNEGLAWLERTLSMPGFDDSTARSLLMAAVPFSRQFWEHIDTVGDDMAEQYWSRISGIRAPRDEWSDAVDVLVAHGRQWKALELLSFMLHEKLAVSVEQVKATFEAIVSGTDAPQDPTMDGYYAQQLLQFLEDSVPDDTDLPRFEFTLFPLLYDNQPSGALYRLLARDPMEFVRMIQAIYRAEGEPKRPLSAQEQAFGHLAFNVLREWTTLPGQRGDGTIDGEVLFEWVRTARLALSDSGRGAVGDEQIGEVLAASPVGTDGIWPAEAVREVIDTLGSPRIDTGIHIGRSNRRGITSRDPFEGGGQERALEKQYRADADLIATRWPRTARVLRGLADSYRDEATAHDLEAESWSDDG